MALSGRTSPLRQSPKWPRRSTSIAATINTICWMKICAASTWPCQFSPNGTIMRRATTGIPTRSSRMIATRSRASPCSRPMPLGPGTVVAGPLRFIKQNKINDLVWVTADVHYTAVHSYDPNKAQFQDFEPFWEFVSGPINAGTFGPNDLDATFGPELKFVKAPEKGQTNLSPAAEMQFFGHVKIDGASEVLTVTLKDLKNPDLYKVDLNPAV